MSVLREKIEFKRNIGWFLLIPIVLCSFSFAVYTNEILLGLNFLIIPVLMIASSLIIINPDIEWLNLSFIRTIIHKATGDTVITIPKSLSFIKVFAMKKSKLKSSDNKVKIIRGILFALPLLIVIIALLSSADMVFNYYIINFTDLFDTKTIDKTFWQLIRILIVGLYLYAFVWSYRINEKSIAKKEVLQKYWDSITVITVLILMNTIYLVFSVIQFSYLYGGNGGLTLPAEFTYAEYARKGFFELVTVTIINFIVLLSCIKKVEVTNKSLKNFTNILFSLMIIFTLNMLFSAHFKLSLYESSYGYTYLRVFVHLFMIVLFILCIICLLWIWTKNFPLGKTIIVTALICYTMVNYMNIDGFIAKRNIQLYKAKGVIDIYYLSNLSYEAIPYIIELEKTYGDELDNVLRERLNYRKKRLVENDSIFEFNISRSNAKKLLSK
jgi:ABC-type multidrug transport system fused ATPase/permease subunit